MKLKLSLDKYYKSELINIYKEDKDTSDDNEKYIYIIVRNENNKINFNVKYNL